MDEDDRLNALRQKVSELYARRLIHVDNMSDILEKVRNIREDYSHQHDFLMWDREAYAKLYYPLWILFIGGFVFSLSTDKYHGPIPAYLAGLIYLFRILALAGTALNFYVQHLALEVLRYEWETEVALRRAMETASFEARNISMEDLTTIEDIEKAVAELVTERNDEKEATRHVERARRKLALSDRKDKLRNKMEIWLMVNSAIFLILMLVLTWRIIP